MGLLELISANEVVAQVISFLILLFLLRVLAWKKILKLLDDRKEKIAGEFKKIEDTKAEVAGLRADFEAKLISIDEIAEKKIEEAVAEGRKITDEVRIAAARSKMLDLNFSRQLQLYRFCLGGSHLPAVPVDDLHTMIIVIAGDSKQQICFRLSPNMLEWHNE